jgi:hypothetical protein
VSSEIVEKLTRVCEARRFATLSRRFQGEPRHHGFIVRVGEGLLLVHQFHDFSSEGLTALRIEDIESVTSGRSERLSAEIIRNERVEPIILCNHDLTDMRSLLQSLRKSQRICIVECESGVWSEDDEFSIGRVISVQSRVVKMACFDPLGRWGREPQEIEISAVTKCQMETPYISAFSRYLGARDYPESGPVAQT